MPRADRISRIVSSSDKGAAIGLETRTFDRSLIVEREMKHHGWSFVRAARAAGMQNSTQMRDMLACHEELAEGRVALVLKRRCKHDLRIARETERPGPTAFIGNDETTYFNIVARGHACFHAQFDAMVPAVELGEVWMEDRAILVWHGPGRLPRCRP